MQRIRAAFLQAVDRRLRERLHDPVRVPAEGFRETRPCAAAAGRQQLDAGHGDARARDGVAAGEADGRAGARVVRAADVPVGDAVDAHRGGLVGAPAAEAVVLVDDDAVPDVLHPHAGELDGRHGAGAALPRLDPEAVVGVDDPRVPDRHVGHAGARVVHAKAADAYAVAVAACYVLDVDVGAAGADGDAVVPCGDRQIELRAPRSSVDGSC